MGAALNTLIELLLYVAACTGAFLLFRGVWSDAWGWVRRTYYGVGHRQMLRVSEGFRTHKRNGKPETIVTRIHDHLDMLLVSTLKQPSVYAVSRFVMGSVVAAGVLFAVLTAALHNLAFGGMTGLVVLFLPYAFLHVRRYHLSINNSYTIAALIDTLVPEYRKQNGSMIHALKATVDPLPKGALRRAVARLTDRLADHVTPEEARTALSRFTAQLGTTWAIQVANDIEHAVVDGVDVEYSLAMTHRELKDVEKARKGQKLARMDSLLVATLPFIMWPLLMGMFYASLTRNILYYQFFTPSGLRWAVLTLLCTLSGFVIGIVFYRPKQDI